MNYPDLTIEGERMRFRESLLECLGGDWPEPPDLEAEVLDESDRGNHTIQKVKYQLEPGEFVSSYLLVPKEPVRTPTPAVAVWHQHHGEYQLGKSEPAGLIGNAVHHTGVTLVNQGYIVICPDAIGFEDRRDYSLKNFELEHFLFLRCVTRGKCLAWKNIYDMRRAIDYLCSRNDVDAAKIGCYGHSLGSTFSWLVAPWEPRLKCIVGNCCLPTYEALEANEILHSFSNYIPGLMEIGDTPDVAALAAPIAMHLNFGALDEGSPIDFITTGLERIERTYESMGAAQNFSYYIEDDAGHTLTEKMWKAAEEKFRQHLMSED